MPPIIEFANGTAAFTNRQLDALWSALLVVRVRDIIDTLPSSQRTLVHAVLCDGAPVGRDHVISPANRITLLRMNIMTREAAGGDSNDEKRAPLVVRYDKRGLVGSIRKDSEHPVVQSLICEVLARRLALEGASVPPVAAPPPASMGVLSRFLALNCIDEGAKLNQVCDAADAAIKRRREKVTDGERPIPSAEERRALLLSILPNEQLDMICEMGFPLEAAQRMLLAHHVNVDQAVNALLACDDVAAVSAPLTDAEVDEYATRYRLSEKRETEASELDEMVLDDSEDPKLAVLRGMGFDRDSSERALTVTGGDVNLACDILLERGALMATAPHAKATPEEEDWNKRLCRLLVANALSAGPAEGGASGPENMRQLLRELRSGTPVDDVRRMDFARRALQDFATVMQQERQESDAIPSRSPLPSAMVSSLLSPIGAAMNDEAEGGSSVNGDSDGE